MGRILKRVPVDFDWPIGRAWSGYDPSMNQLKELFGKQYNWLNQCRNTEDICKRCPGSKGKINQCGNTAPYCIWHNPDLKAKWHIDPPKGDGYQAWQDTSSPSPISPVFTTMDELCKWCAEHETVFARIKATPEEWKELFAGETDVVLKKGGKKNNEGRENEIGVA